MAGKVFKYTVLAVIAVNLVIVAVVFTGGNGPAARPLPNPNGYDDFVKAGQMVQSNKYDYATQKDRYDYVAISMDTLPAHRAQLTAFVATNSMALQLVRTGLGKECSEPVEDVGDYVDRRQPEMASFKLLAYLLCTEGHVAELNNQTDQAAEIYLDGIRFSQQLARGGLIISRMVGVADERIALRPLSGLRPRCSDPAECRKIASALEKVDAEEEPAASTIDRERSWEKRTFGIRVRIWLLFNYNLEQGIESHVTAKVQAVQLDRRKLIIDFAARAYELETGKKPHSVTDLMPGYLKAVPKDPVTGKDLGLGR